MKQSLQLRVGQHLSLTPQLQQAIRLLQFSTLELQSEIQQTIESNPMLEMDEQDNATPEKQPSNSEAEHAAPVAEATSLPEDIPDKLSVDSEWEDTFDTGALPSTSGSSASHSDSIPDDYLASNSAPVSLQNQLLEQLNMLTLSDRDHVLGEALIDAIDDSGFLTQSVGDFVDMFADAEPPVDAEELSAVLHHIQHFDPVGVGARDPKESLLLQLAQLPKDTPARDEADLIVRYHLRELTRGEHDAVLKRLHIDKQTLDRAVDLIRSLNPRPGSAVGVGSVDYVTPDVYVRREKNRWVVRLNDGNLPQLRINDGYAALIRRGDSSADNQFLRNNLQEARWFLKSLQSRNETLMRVTTAIVERQQEFLQHGEVGMKPMVLRDIAEALEMHESTISRVTTRKFMHTPRGVFELKYFFSSHIASDSGNDHSSTAIRARIKELVSEEPPNKPLSDNRIATLLGKQGVKVARRTVAKYREAMLIPPSNERKRLV